MCVCVCVCVLTLTEMKKKKVEAEESWDMMMMMMRMGGNVPHLDFDFVDGEWTMFQRKVACVCKCVTGSECGTERYIKTKQPNTHSSPYTHNQGKVSQQLTSPTCLSFQPSTQSRSKRQFQSTPLHLNLFFFF